MSIYKRGNTWWADFKRGEDRIRQSLDTTKRAEAERIAKILSKFMPDESGIPSTAMKRVRSSRSHSKQQPTVREILRQWLAYQETRRKPNSVHAYRIAAKRFSYVWGDLQPEEVTRRKVEQFQETALRLGLAPRTINHQLGLEISPSPLRTQYH